MFLDELLKLNDEGVDFTDKDLKDEVITMTVAVIITTQSPQLTNIILEKNI